MGKLTAVQIQRFSKTGRYGDGDGLYLQVRSKVNKSWLFRYMLDGSARQMGLGPYPEISLAVARQKAASQRQLLKDPDKRLDPITERNRHRAARKLAEAKGITFATAASRYIASHRAGWKNPKHAAQWENTLAQYAIPKLGETNVADIDTALVMLVLTPIWTTKNETASRVRARVESILDWAKVQGARDGAFRNSC
ncbi:MAG: Arm DNA-binding domain-containing protein [Pseudomonadota bacterium]|nr:Arm DNA-binding domain-containing protein [Pseudomonadota bacterium]